MGLKRYVNGKWIEIAGPSTSNFTKAINVGITDLQDLYETENVEGALAEIGTDIKNIKTQLKNHTSNHPSGGGGTGALPTITSDFEIKNDECILVSPNGSQFKLTISDDGTLNTKRI